MRCSRRDFIILTAASAATLACSEGDETVMADRVGLPPWHLWGNTKVVEIRNDSGLPAASPLVGSQQLIRISYGRPELWRWLFHARIIETDITGNGQGAILSVLWQLTTGVGRSQVKLDNFEHFDWQSTPLSNSIPGQDKYSTQSRSPAPQLDGTVHTIIDHIPAQDIQLSVLVGVVNVSGGTFVKVECSAFFTPNVHIRPEWFIGQFPGGETSGT